MKKNVALILMLLVLAVLAHVALAEDVKLSDDASGFVLLSEAVPDAILEIRYYSTYNFVGERIDGYEEPVALLTKEAAAALREVSDDLMAQGYRLKIYDAYRPQKAVTHFVNWAQDADDTRMKQYFYPELDKDVLFPQGYIMEHSGHSRGSTLDLTLFDMTTEKEVDMGGTFDYFGPLSHPDYTDITGEQYANRMILRETMLAHGFRPLDEEWWHFTLADEPYPDTYFTFPVSSASVQSVEEAPAEPDQDVQYVLFLGTNDKDTNKPVFTQEEARQRLRQILIDHFGGYTIQDALGGWVGDDGTEYREYTLIVYLSDTTLDKVRAAADEMIKTFNQSSVLIQTNPTRTEFYSPEN